uniref:ATP synthase complex subunit 8 n=1 Tax=Phrynosoma blainvillii TaxID=372482 RepID=A0A343RF49_9SAUR|nr:ATP synthase F0 subunit 8 [Phrynosoma blainvillii]ATY40966.1 ATP synthase F0 subunit 8 [Phrynosoma blainvillii]
MPQLNPSPWFLIMLMTWATLMFIFLNKTLNMLFPSTPAQIQPKAKPLMPWSWPWL